MARNRRNPPPQEERQRIRERVKAMAWLLDSAIRLPGGFRIGIDALIGVVPVLGDAIGVLLSGYILMQAVRAGAPSSLLLRMGWNVAVEGVIGAVPLLGDIFDAAWKANMRNAALLDLHLQDPGASRKSSRFFAVILVLSLVVFLLLMAALFFVVLGGIKRFLG
ncbi:MAG: DUF4112 domain-containing protein [Betaproteobacteria bacterium]